MFFNKKGAEIVASNLVTILLILIGGMVILGVMFTIFGEKDDLFSRWICKASVYISDQTGGVGDKIPLVPSTILCKTFHKEVKEEEEKDFMREMARGMQRCWDMWGEGDWDPSPNWLKWDEKKCFNCYVMETGDDVPQITLKEFIDYLQSTEEKKVDDTYWNYFRGLSGNKVVFNFPEVDDFRYGSIFKKNSFYAITYVEDVDSAWWGTVLIGVGAGFVEGASVGAIAAGTICTPLGVGALVCGVGGGVVGGVAGGFVAGTYEVLEAAFAEPRDGIMISAYNDWNNVKKKCSTEIE